MHPPDDLDEYLRGDSALSRQYRNESATAPPHALDRRVLKLSRESPEVRASGEARGARASRDSRRSRESPDSRTAGGGMLHLAPLAFAASVLLSVALVLAIVFGPQTAKRADDAPRLVRAAATRTEAPLKLYSSDPKLARPRAAWLADIAALRRAGRDREADAELRRFRSTYPDYSTADLKIPP